MKLVLVLLALLLSGCTPVSAVKNTSKIRTVAVVSAGEDLLTMEYRGWFEVKKEEVPIDWGLRTRMSDRLTAALAKTYEIKALAEDPVPSLIEATKPIRGSNFVGPTDIVVDQIKRLVKPDQVDAVVVAVDKAGALYHYQSGPGGDFPFYIGYTYLLFVFDGHTLGLLGHEFGSIYRKRPLGIIDYDNPAIDIDLAWRGEPYAALPEEKKEYIRRGIYELIDRSVPFTLQNRLHFIP